MQTFNIEVNGNTIECKRPLWRRCLSLMAAYGHAQGNDDPDNGELTERDEHAMATIHSAIIGCCLPASVGAPKFPPTATTVDDWLAYGEQVDIWLYRSKWTTPGKEWSAACGAAFDQVAESFMVTSEEVADRAAAPFEASGAPSSDG